MTSLNQIEKTNPNMKTKTYHRFEDWVRAANAARYSTGHGTRKLADVHAKDGSHGGNWNGKSGYVIVSGRINPVRLSWMGEREFGTYAGWRAAVKKAGATKIEGDKDIAHSTGPDNKGNGEWDGETGVIYNLRNKTKSNPTSLDV